MVVKPTPDSIDDYDLHAIEKVHAVEETGVVSDRYNGIKHNEYWLLIPGFEKGARMIDLQHAEGIKDVHQFDKEILSTLSLSENNGPTIGDVYLKVQGNEEAMVIAIQEENVILGGNQVVAKKELIDHDKWLFLYNILDKR